VVVLLTFQTILRITAWGAVLRATCYDRDLALLQGVRVQMVVSASFFISAALAGIAGLLLAPVTGISPTFGFGLMLSGFTAIVVGGVGSSVGALVGGLTVGITELAVGGYVGSSWQHVVSLVVLIAILMFRPSGLFGTHRRVKV
jgi:branched-chain amino acid transport system permease protein